MSEVGIALIAAGSAVAGSVVTGWYGRIAAGEQARAALRAGDRQAEAMLETVRLTQAGQAAEHAAETRRQAYVRFLDAAETAAAVERGQGGSDARAALQQALAEVVLEGPDDVSTAASACADLLRRHARADEVERAKQTFITAARAVLHT